MEVTPYAAPVIFRPYLCDSERAAPVRVVDAKPRAAARSISRPASPFLQAVPLFFPAGLPRELQGSRDPFRDEAN
jgi:hypothetical protein